MMKIAAEYEPVMGLKMSRGFGVLRSVSSNPKAFPMLPKRGGNFTEAFDLFLTISA